MGEHILEADEPQHCLLGHLLGERVADQEELDDSRRLFLLGHLVTRPPQQVLLEDRRPLYNNTETVSLNNVYLDNFNFLVSELQTRKNLMTPTNFPLATSLLETTFLL